MNENKTILRNCRGTCITYSKQSQFSRKVLAGFFGVSTFLQNILLPVPAPEDLQKEIENVVAYIESSTPKPIGEHYTIVESFDYTVEDGDNIHSIARDLKKENIWVTPKQIIEWNNLNGPRYYLDPGRIIKINKLSWDKQIVEASWYGPGFQGRPMANTKIFDQNDIVAAHMHLPLNMKVRVTNLENGKSLVIPITDRGNFEKYNRGIDLSKQAAKELGYQGAGVTQVLIEPLHTL
ncbi:MAG: hypothetical protein COU90_03185 [Candidatus Ryanbacteria bacterium CG10_big_fil_rev_8_21_14_0_10_43_42]|uniref:Probable endolytic peptidoglycan transglycosylase RlpA n=1 Tax=Candidatus Ryanbacteria bacterium CG10_big_fil_rev_8_21_14_0_10_43_42 TaxID=1974864 RepID=A0A2M8KWW8_9BACT|nr:MAG: hypothetical protein COU90_03185 [Candidatus Ryanbacteria bacterium CG10_big_fil_rev_8_21_14_0_10_43_42]